MARASAHYEQVEDLMAPEILMSAVEYGQLQCIDHSAHSVDNPAGKEPSEGDRGHGVEDLGKCKHAGSAHSDVQD